MIEVQCPSCQTRYRIDEGVLPQDSPTFKCSRCGHVFSGDPRLSKRPCAPASTRAAAAPPKSPPPQDNPASPPAPSAGPPPDPSATPAEAPASVRQPPVQPIRTAPPGGLSDGAAQPRPGPADPAPQRQASAPPPRPAAPRTTRAAQQPADNPLARSFADDESRTPENLSFDFDDPAEQHQLGEETEPADGGDRYDRWRVGEPDAEPAAPIRPELSRYRQRRAALAQAARRADRAPEPEAPQYEKVRSAGFFLGLFALVVAGFAILTFVLGLSPWISRELLAQVPVIGAEFAPVPAHESVVSLSEVHAEYRTLDGHRRALIISGRAENRGAEPLHTIQVGVSLIDMQQRPIISQSVYCGDLVSPKIVSQMTPHELQFFQKLAPPRNFALRSGDSSPFFVMFIDPPSNVANFQVSVLKAETASDSTAPAGV